MNNLSIALKHRELIKRVALYVLMVSAIGITVTFAVLFMLGYRFDIDKGQIEQYAIIQLNSAPSGATVTVDGEMLHSKTPTKITTPSGRHEIVMQLKGYDKWHKTVDVESGTMTWLNYTLMVPSELSIEPIVSYKSLYASLASPDNRRIIVQENAANPTFNLVNITADEVKTTKLVIAADLYSSASTGSTKHVFKAEKWDENGRHILVRHVYNDETEWLALDTQNMSLAKNITTLFNASISDINFSDNSGNVFYILNRGNIRKIDLSAGTMSKALVSNALTFDIHNESNVLTYVGKDSSGKNRVVGIYHDGESKPYVLRTISGSENLQIKATHYFNEDYVAILDGYNVDILGGTYPSSSNNDEASMKTITSFAFKHNDSNLSFSPTGEYLMVNSGLNFVSYDLEYQELSSSSLAGTATMANIGWLNNNYIWSDLDGELTICEFDGTNKHIINSILPGQDIIITRNGRYIYSLGKLKDGYQLQRVRMILP